MLKSKKKKKKLGLNSHPKDAHELFPILLVGGNLNKFKACSSIFSSLL
jgi:hypothetical protein